MKNIAIIVLKRIASVILLPVVLLDTLQGFLDGYNGDERKIHFYEE